MRGDTAGYTIYFCIAPPLLIICFCLICFTTCFEYRTQHNSQHNHVAQRIHIVPQPEPGIKQKQEYHCVIDLHNQQDNVESIVLGKNENTFVVVVNPS